MGQFIFFALFIITLLAGGFAYFASSHKVESPMKFMMENTGYDSVEALNQKRVQQINMTTSKGLVHIRSLMDDLAAKQNKLLDTLQDQKQILEHTGKVAKDIMLEAQQNGQKGNKDILQLQALASEMQDEQRLLVAHGQDLIVLNDQLTKNRQWIADQIDSANINNETSLSALQQRYVMLKDQAKGFFDKVSQHNQEVRDQMGKMKDQLHDLANNAAFDSTEQQQNAKERIGRMMDREHEDMLKLADTEERNRDLLKDAQQNFSDSKEQFNDSLQQTQDLIEQERQKAEDQQWITQQRVADQMQRMKDQQNK